MSNSQKKIDAPHGNIADHVKEKARFAHLRNSSPETIDGFAQSPGATIAFMDQGDEYFAAVAFCNPLDNFNKSTGRIKSSGRLVSAVLGTSAMYDNPSLYYLGNKESHGDFKLFKAAVIKQVAEYNFYDVLPGPKKEK